MTILEAANKTSYSQKQIRRYVQTGLLKAEKRNGKWFINPKDIMVWAENVKTGKMKRIEIESSVFLDKKSSTQNESNFINVEKETKKDTWKKFKPNGMKFAEIFAGAGGLSAGFVMAGYEPVAAVEILPYAVNTYRRNILSKFPGHGDIESRDIRKPEVKKELINKLKENNVDIIIGGFPCQGFSMSGPRVVCDKRNTLYLDMLEVVKQVKPKYVMMENVEGLRSMLNGELEKKIIADYQKSGYNIALQTLNSADYGVAQKRKRVIFIAKLKTLGEEISFPDPFVKEKNYKTLGEEIERFMDLSDDPLINHIATRHSTDMAKRISEVPEGKSLYKGYSDAWKKSPWDKPSCTVKENHGGVNLHPKLPRVLTARELAALQSFPDDFIFEGSKSQQLIQIGNAVPPIMGKAIAIAIKNSTK